MHLKRLRLKNYRLFEEIDVAFQKGMNVLIGKNNTGKSVILEAIDLLHSVTNDSALFEEIVPYDLRGSENVSSCIEGFFAMTDSEKENICSILGNAEFQDLVRNSHLEITYTKHIGKLGKTPVTVTPQFTFNENGVSKDNALLNQVLGFLLPKFQSGNSLKIIDAESYGAEPPLLPSGQLNQIFQSRTLLPSLPWQFPSQVYLNQYLRSKLYEIKHTNSGEFNKIKNDMLKAYSKTEDMDIEFNSNFGQIQVYFKKEGSDCKRPLEGESRGIREFFYSLLTLHKFPDSVIFEDEAFTHLHKALLNELILAIEGLKYQMITTSHIKELIDSLDFANVIVCRKEDENGKATAKNLMSLKDRAEVLAELGYPLGDVPEELSASIRDIP
jgi:AAA15 family ATPase/GTPase